jgi:5'-methylthioadenosine phosphorylase
MAGLENVERVSLDTPYGSPSDEYVLGTSGGQRLAFLPRHGVGHRLLPSELNFRANVHGFKQLGADTIVSLSAVGSLREDIAPGHVVVPDQLIDRTRGRISTFFGDGVVAHVSFADPFCPELSRVLVACARESGAAVHEGGTYVCMEGPQFSTRAESKLYRSWGGDVIGMTNLQEAKLAREAEICFATLAMATDYDCWRTQSEVVDIDTVLQVLAANSELARQTVRLLAERAPKARGCRCRQALDGAIITERGRIPARRYAELAVIAGRVLAGGEPS